QLVDAAAADQLLLHDLLRLVREQLVDGVHPVGDGELRRPLAAGAVGRLPAAALVAGRGLEQEADELLDALGLRGAAAADAVPPGDVAQDQPPAGQRVRVGGHRYPPTIQ